MRRAGVATERGHTGDPNIDAIWRRLREITDQMNASPFVGGRLITQEMGPDVLPGSGLLFTGTVARSIPHGLGRKARGFIEVYGVDVPSAARVGLRATAHPTGTTSEKHVTVTPAATGTCWIWVFG
jgi:hypothetical protein